MKLRKLSDTFRDPEHGEKAVPLAPDGPIKREPLGDDEALNKAYLKKREEDEEDGGTQTDGGFDPSGDPPPPPPVTEQDPPQLPESYRQSIGALGGAIALAGGSMDTYGPEGAPDGVLNVFDALAIIDFWAQFTAQSPAPSTGVYTQFNNAFFDPSAQSYTFNFGTFYNPLNYDPETGEGAYMTFQDLLDSDTEAPIDWPTFSFTSGNVLGENTFDAIFNAYQGDVPEDFFETLLVNPNPQLEDFDDLGSWFDLNMLPIINIYADIALYNLNGSPLGYSDDNLSEFFAAVDEVGGSLGLAPSEYSGTSSLGLSLSSFDVNGDGTFNGADITAWVDVTEMIQVVQAIQNGESVSISETNSIYSQEDIDAIVEYYNYYGQSIGSGNLYFDTEGVWDDTQNLNDISGEGDAALNLIGVVGAPPAPPSLTLDEWKNDARGNINGWLSKFQNAFDDTSAWLSNYDVDWGQAGPDNFSAANNLGAWWTDCMTWFYNYAQDMADGFQDGQYLSDSPALTFTLEDLLTLNNDLGFGQQVGPLIFDSDWLAENNLTTIFENAPWPDWMLPSSSIGQEFGFHPAQIATFMWLNFPYGTEGGVEGDVFPGSVGWSGFFIEGAVAALYDDTVYNGSASEIYLWGILSQPVTIGGFEGMYGDYLFNGGSATFASDIAESLWTSIGNPTNPGSSVAANFIWTWDTYINYVSWYNEGVDYGYVTGGTGGYIEYVDLNGYPQYYILPEGGLLGGSPYSEIPSGDINDLTPFVIAEPPTLNEDTPGSLWLSNRPSSGGAVAPEAYMQLMLQTAAWRENYDVDIAQTGDPLAAITTFTTFYADSLLEQIFGGPDDFVDPAFIAPFVEAYNEISGASLSPSDENVVSDMESGLQTPYGTTGIPLLYVMSGWVSNLQEGSTLGDFPTSSLITGSPWYEFINSNYTPPPVLDLFSDGSWTFDTLQAFTQLVNPYGDDWGEIIGAFAPVVNPSFYEMVFSSGTGSTGFGSDSYEAFFDNYFNWLGIGFATPEIASEFGFDNAFYTGWFNNITNGFGYIDFTIDPTLQGHYEGVNLIDTTVFYTLAGDPPVLQVALGVSTDNLFNGTLGGEDSYSWANWLKSTNGLVDFSGDGVIDFGDWCNLWSMLFSSGTGGVVNNYDSGTPWQQFGLYDAFANVTFFNNFGQGSLGPLSGFQLNWIGFGALNPLEAGGGQTGAWNGALDSLVESGGEFDAYLSFTGSSDGSSITSGASGGSYDATDVAQLVSATAGFFYYWEAVQETQSTGSVPDWYLNTQAPPSFAPFAAGEFDGVAWADGGANFWLFGGIYGSVMGQYMPSESEMLAYVDYLDTVGVDASQAVVLDNDGTALNLQSTGQDLLSGLADQLVSIANQNYIAAYFGNYNAGAGNPLTLDFDGNGIYDSQDSAVWGDLEGFIETAIQNGLTFAGMIDLMNQNAVAGGRAIITGDVEVALGYFLYDNGFFQTAGAFGDGFYFNDVITGIGDNSGALAEFEDILSSEYDGTTVFNGLDGEQFAWGSATFYASATDGTYNVTGSYAPGSPAAQAQALRDFIAAGAPLGLPFDFNGDGVFSTEDVAAFATFIDIINNQIGGDPDMVAAMGLAGFDTNQDGLFNSDDIDAFTAFFGSFGEDGSLQSVTMNLFGYFNAEGQWVDYGQDELLPSQYFGSDWSVGIDYAEEYEPLPGFPLPPPPPTT